MKKLFSLFVALIATCALWASNVITYTATSKLTYFRTGAFNVSITSHTFSNGVGTITFSGDVTSIGGFAFQGCSGLTSITIPNSVTSIGYYAFSHCSGLTSITIPNSVTSIGESAFEVCTSLTSIVVESGNPVYDSRNNCNAIIETSSNTLVVGCQNTIIPNSVTSIGEGTFYNCSGLTSITIPNSVTSIGERAFFGCSGLTSTTIPSSVTSIGNGAFKYCTGLTSITIPNSVTSIGEKAFYVCSGLTSIVVESGNPVYDSRNNCNAIIETSSNTLVVGCQNTTIPNSVTSIGDYAFEGCTNLTSITIPNSVTSIGEEAFYDCSGLTSITIPNSVTSIGSYAFEGCSGLTSITIPNSVTSIGEEAFYGCSGLTSITIPNSVTSIGEEAFKYCTGLTSITIPNSVTSIGERAFAECTKLRYYTCYAPEPPMVDQTTFSNYNVYLNVPCDYLDEYKFHAVWGSFRYIECIGAEESAVTTITVTPSANDATFAWPTSDGANTYTLTITKDGVLFCTLTFNANGQLLNIAFAPGRDGAAPAPAAELTATGYQFTVIGLESGSTYSYTLSAKDAGNNVVATYNGTFTTQWGMGFDAVNKYVDAPSKLLRDGQILIQRGAHTFTLQGQVVE